MNERTYLLLHQSVYPDPPIEIKLNRPMICADRPEELTDVDIEYGRLAVKTFRATGRIMTAIPVTLMLFGQGETDSRDETKLD